VLFIVWITNSSTLNIPWGLFRSVLSFGILKICEFLLCSFLVLSTKTILSPAWWKRPNFVQGGSAA
jgi:hypothetical protein